MEEPNYRIGFGMSAILIFLAVCADLIGMIPFMQYVTAGAFWIGAELYFHIKGIKTFSGKALPIKVVSWLISLIPFLQSIPVEIVSATIAIIVVTRIEDRSKIKVIQKQGVTPPRLQRRPVNNEPGIRRPNNSNNVVRMDKYDESEDLKEAA